MMIRQFLFFIFCVFIYSCSEKENTSTSELGLLTFSVDTVMVDAGDDILYLRDNLWFSDISADGKYLYNFDRNDAVLEKIDLDNLTLVKKIQYEKEGPNGIGTFVSNFSITSDGHIMLWSYGLSSVFDQNGKLIKNLNFDKIASDELNKSGAYPMSLFECLNDQNRYIGFYIKWEDRSYFLLDVDTKKNTYSKIELPELGKINEFAVDLVFEGNWVGNFGVSTSSLGNSDNILIINNAINEAYIFNTTSDTLFLNNWYGPLTGSKKTYLGPKQVEFHSAQHWEVSKKIDEDINYGNMLWDSEKQRYFRLSFKQIFGEEKQVSGAFKPVGAEVFLSVFDRDFNLIAESLVPDLNKRPDKHFVKDGQIWIFENIDDEMGFIRLSVE
jgi:hypothetical protein